MLVKYDQGFLYHRGLLPRENNLLGPCPTTMGEGHSSQSSPFQLSCQRDERAIQEETRDGHRPET